MADAVVYRAMQDIQSAIQGAITGGTLVGLSSSNVFIQKIATDRNQQNFPFVTIAPIGEELPATGTNDLDTVVYKILVAIVNNDNQDQAGNAAQGIGFEQELQWKQNIRRLFHMKQLGPLTTESVKTTVKSLITVDPSAWYANLWLCAIEIDAECREVRTQDAS
ncbi:MAG TPA: hypothetical protein VEI07_18635 [Planctomycetaceae bacterium]|nr:hypothetical protein [Planctomycetaceae bacterium]HXY36260.1 hypothetical protein [Planctomycetaceae bacterium]